MMYNDEIIIIIIYLRTHSLSVVFKFSGISILDNFPSSK